MWTPLPPRTEGPLKMPGGGNFATLQPFKPLFMVSPCTGSICLLLPLLEPLQLSNFSQKLMRSCELIGENY